MLFYKFCYIRSLYIILKHFDLNKNLVESLFTGHHNLTIFFILYILKLIWLYINVGINGKLKIYKLIASNINKLFNFLIILESIFYMDSCRICKESHSIKVLYINKYSLRSWQAIDFTFMVVLRHLISIFCKKTTHLFLRTLLSLLFYSLLYFILYLFLYFILSSLFYNKF